MIWRYLPRCLSPQGVFLPTSYRMHPALCSIVSELVYDGRLSAHPSASERSLQLPQQQPQQQQQQQPSVIAALGATPPLSVPPLPTPPPASPPASPLLARGGDGAAGRRLVTRGEGVLFVGVEHHGVQPYPNPNPP